MVDSYRGAKLGERAFKAALLSIPSVQTECNQNAIKINTERMQVWPFYKREPRTNKTHLYNEFERSTLYTKLIHRTVIVP